MCKYIKQLIYRGVVIRSYKWVVIRSYKWSPFENWLKIFLVEKYTICTKGFFPHLRGYKVTLFFRAPQMGVYKVKGSFFECRKWVLIRSHNFQNHPQAGDLKVKCWFCVRPYNHPPVRRAVQRAVVEVFPK